jgi:HSP20 family protein
LRQAFARRSSANTGPNQGGCEEGEQACTVQAEVPGVAKEDIHVSLDGNVVTLRAEVKQHDTQSRDAKVLRSEPYFGAVSRSFQLTLEID